MMPWKHAFIISLVMALMIGAAIAVMHGIGAIMVAWLGETVGFIVAYLIFLTLGLTLVLKTIEWLADKLDL
jgi:hypothetical protein